MFIADKRFAGTKLVYSVFSKAILSSSGLVALESEIESYLRAGFVLCVRCTTSSAEFVLALLFFEFLGMFGLLAN